MLIWYCSMYIENTCNITSPIYPISPNAEIVHQLKIHILLYDSGYPHDGRADKNPYPHDRRADKDSYPHDSNNQCIILRLQLSFVMINEQMMLV